MRNFRYSSLSDGSIKITKYVGTAEGVEIPSVISGKKVSTIGDNAFYYCTSVTSVLIPDGITSIEEFAFYGCSSLTNVSIPDSVSSIDGCAFGNCTSLENVTLPNSVTSINESAFINTALYNNTSNWNDGVLYIGPYLISGKLRIFNERTHKEEVKK